MKRKKKSGQTVCRGREEKTNSNIGQKQRGIHIAYYIILIISVWILSSLYILYDLQEN